MTINKMGWDLPPGVTSRMIDEAAGVDEPCECCGKSVDECICEECPNCHETGNPECYEGSETACTEFAECPKCFEGTCTHAEGMNCLKPRLRYTKQQRLGQSELRLSAIRDSIVAEEQYRAWIMDKPDDWRDGNDNA